MATEKKYAETPLMKQYNAIKAVHGDAILLFRVGDFYETFGQDAITASGVLGITLTRRANGAAAYVELAGFPYHAMDTYLPKLVRAGYRVAVCDQLEDPKTVKGIVKRGVTELVTPGTAMSDNMLSPKGNTFLGSVYFGKNSTGVAFLDLSTGEFLAAEGTDEYIDKLISNLAPKEIIYQRGTEERFREAFGNKLYTYRLDEWVFSEQINREKLCKQFECKSLKGYGIDSMSSAVSAAGAILYYLDFTEHNNVKHIRGISRIDEDQYVWIDRFTIRNLELFSSNSLRTSGGFAEVIDRTVSPMGGRLLRRWIALPIKDVAQITERQQVVAQMIAGKELLGQVSDDMATIGDIERIASRVAAARAMPRELVQLKNGLAAISNIRDVLLECGDAVLQGIASQIEPCAAVREKIGVQIYPDPSNLIAKGNVIADGVDMELDDLRRIANNGKSVISDIQERESIATGIPSLKISFNNVFGYYIEVRNAHKDKVPETWIRKQTLTTAERYITAELKEYEEKILGAEGRMVAIEQRLYDELISYITEFIRPIQENAMLIARLDCLASFAKIAMERNYCRPDIDNSKVLDIKQGRHPVIETLLPVGESYIPNDLYLDTETQQIIMITGPNMSGKSALLRQTALIVLMAQMGSYVPASAVKIGVVDKIFTRVGASDNISEGESTFMVEMLESATIMNNVSDRSLVLLDEIGRGTSTYDGISIAWSMVEYLHNHPTARAKTLFATHYHELNEMEQVCARVKNFNVSVREINRSIVFMRKLEPGGTAHSFGIHVAKMAGMPHWIVERSEQMLSSLEATHRSESLSTAPTAVAIGSNSSLHDSVQRKRSKPASIPFEKVTGMQLSMFQLDDPVLIQIRDQIRGIDINSLTPLEALNKLSEIKKITGI